MEGKVRLFDDCTLFPVTGKDDLVSFTCGNSDLDDFFHQDAYLYSKQLLGKSYFFATNEQKPEIVAAVTLANDSIKAALISGSARNKIQRKIPNSKRTRSYPAVLIGRLGVATKFQGTGSFIGTQVLEYIASWFVHSSNKTGCRFMVVDAYNKPEVLHFYEKNDFKYLYSTEELEKEANHIPFDARLESRMMYVDLLGYIHD